MRKKLIAVVNMRQVKIYSVWGRKLKNVIKQYTADELNIHHRRQERHTGFYKEKNTQSHFFDPHSEAISLEKEDFSKVIALTLDNMCREGRFDELIIIAEPKMLGKLRKNFSSETAKIISREIPKDLTHANNELIELNAFN